MSAIKKVTIISIVIAALASAGVKIVPVFFRNKFFLRTGKKAVSMYSKWKIAKFIERMFFRMGRREHISGWRRILWFARG